MLARVGSAPPKVDPGLRKVTVAVSGGKGILADALRELDAAGIAIDDVALQRPSLDDVFLTLTGHAVEDQAPEEADLATVTKGMS